jgi:hypothetical protein
MFRAASILFDEDTEADARGTFCSAIAEGLSPHQAAERALEVMHDYLQDSEDRPRVIVALAALLVECGVPDHPAYLEARAALETGVCLQGFLTHEAREERRLAEQQLLECLQGSEPKK